MKFLISNGIRQGELSCFRNKLENKARTRGGGSQADEARTGVSVLKLSRDALVGHGRCLSRFGVVGPARRVWEQT